MPYFCLDFLNLTYQLVKSMWFTSFTIFSVHKESFHFYKFPFLIKLL